MFNIFSKEILEKVLDKHRQGIVVKQVAAGREFQGCPFYSKPDVIHFKVCIVPVFSLKFSKAFSLIVRMIQVLAFEHYIMINVIEFYFIKGFWSREDLQEESDLDKCFLHCELLQVHKHYWDVEGLHWDPVSTWLLSSS